MLATFLVPLVISAVTIKDVTGIERSVPDASAKATVMLYVGVDCPIANRMAPEIARIARDYSPRKVSFLLVYPDQELKGKDVVEHLQAYGINAPAAIDMGHLLVKAYKPSVTPQAIVVGPKGKVLYNGRINDLYEEHGKIKAKPTRNDLRVALDEILSGKAVSVPITQTVGCFIGD